MYTKVMGKEKEKLSGKDGPENYFYLNLTYFFL
jgi:hypothetical protein